GDGLQPPGEAGGDEVGDEEEGEGADDQPQLDTLLAGGGGDLRQLERPDAADEVLRLRPAVAQPGGPVLGPLRLLESTDPPGQVLLLEGGGLHHALEKLLLFPQQLAAFREGL